MKSTRRLMVFVIAALLSGCGGADDDGVATPEESASLTSLREEEKLARDVYTALNGQAALFANIAASEQTHTDAVRALLLRYGIDDPAADRGPGSFAAPAFQALHDALVARGRTTPIAALQVGVEIEELDLADIAAMRPLAAHEDVRNTLDNLARGSRNHLRSFWAQLQAAGGTYTPQHLDEATFRAVLAQPQETGRPP